MCRHYLLRCPLLRYRTPGRAAALVAAALLTPLAGQVVINEIYYDPAPKTARHEFVEILNAGAGAVDVSGWRLTSGVDATAPVGTVLEPGAFVLLRGCGRRGFLVPAPGRARKPSRMGSVLAS